MDNSTAYTPKRNLQDMLCDDIPEENDVDEEESSDDVTPFYKFTKKNEKNKFMDSVSAVSKYNMLRKKHELDCGLYRKYQNMSNEEILREYHLGNVDAKTKEWLRNEVFLKMFFLIPYIVRQSYNMPSHMFNDAVQNMSYAILLAIEKFDPTRGFTFVNYLVGYFKSAISKTFKDSNVVSVPTGRKKILQEMQHSRCGDEDNGSNEISFYTGMEYTDNCFEGSTDFDFERNMHNKELVDCLRDAMSREAKILTDDERMVTTLHYGLFKHPQQPYHKIAVLRAKKHRGCAYSRLSQICTKAVKKLRRHFVNKRIEEY